MSEAMTGPTTVEKLLTERLGHGSFGTVYKAFYRDKWAAVKKFPKPQNLKHLKLKNQSLESLIDLKHENVLQIYEIIFENGYGYIMMEYAESGTLHDFLHGNSPPTSYSWPVALNWGLQIAEGIAFLHGMSEDPIIHGDIRPQKILLSSGGRRLKITGLDLIGKQNVCENPILSHMAPEIVERDKYTEKIDVYSWAITFWELLTLKEPRYDVALAINLMLDGTPESVKDLIFKCIVRSPNERYHIRNAVSRLKTIIANNGPSKCGSLSTLQQVHFAELNLHKNLGYGSTSTAYKAFWRDGMIAVKQIYYTINPMHVKEKLTELSSVNHINVTSLFGICFHDGTLNLLLEYAENGSLHQFLHGPLQYKYSNKLAIDWGLQMAKGMAHLHAMRPNPIIHGNVNPRNILLSRGGQLLKLSLPLPSKKQYSVYRAPEVVVNTVRTAKSDIYSWAFIMWEILTRTEPSMGLILSFADETDCSNAIKNLITNSSEKTATKRPAMKIIIDQMLIHLKELKGKIQNEEKTQLHHELFGGTFRYVHFREDKLMAVQRVRAATHCEINNLSQLKHVNILDIYGFSINDNITYCLMEYAVNGSLHDFLHGEWQPKYSLHLAIHWGLQLAEGIAYLHSIPLAHGSINPNNIFLTASCRLVKIFYFGSETQMSMAEDTAIWYRAPEVNGNDYITCKSDIYSWAITMNEILRREEPVDEPFNKFANIILTDDGEALYNTTMMPGCPEDLIILMNYCWKKDESNRPDINHVVNELKTLFHNSSWEIKVLPHWESTESIDAPVPGCFPCKLM